MLPLIDGQISAGPTCAGRPVGTVGEPMLSADHLAIRLAEALEDNAAVRAQFLQAQRGFTRQARRQVLPLEVAIAVVIPALGPDDLAY